MTELSPAAQAVLDAAFTLADNLDRDVTEAEMIAAALRALAGANAYEVEGEGRYSLVIDVDDIYAIADELEGNND
jgi:hypothetical protein